MWLLLNDVFTVSIDEVGNDSSYENGEVDERITEDIETVSSLYNCKSNERSIYVNSYTIIVR